jgi:hypothetical protein
MRDPIQKESRVHGREWETLHNGYFSDAAVAEPFLKTVLKAAHREKPTAVVDLGGGTGFLLGELVRRGIKSSVALVNFDASAKQLETVREPRIVCRQGSIDRLDRENIVPKPGKWLLIMRSVLHYYGEAGLLPLLTHLRSQTAAGERFIHQTACFDLAEDAGRLNALYLAMESGKWYPTAEMLVKTLERTGWRADSAVTAPPLELTSTDLEKRYGLNTARLSEIEKMLLTRFGEEEGVFERTPGGFRLFLHYRIYDSIAV